MSEFYQSIADHYDDIFPLSDTLRKFLFSFGIMKEDFVLDIGCATGEAALYLAQYARNVTGIDLDPNLIKIANFKKDERASDDVRFLIGDMNDLDNIVSPGQFRLITCLGNTLVHLLSIDAINDFLRKVSTALSNDGLFVFQILNYEKILAQKTAELSLIDNNEITFERRYDHETYKPLLVFNTSLRVKATSERINNSIPLFPIRQTELMKMPSRHLFRSIRFLGGFDGKIFSTGDDLLIEVWHK